MTQIEKKAWELIGQLTPVQQYYLALKILQSVEPRNIEEVSADAIENAIHGKAWKGRDEIAQLILSRKQELEEGIAEPISVEQFTADIRRRVKQHRS
ncbi:MAG: hypothetical protein D6730_12580 [Bacteroidetes bacterium]|nr:MAG: hypothetical protein D6730_12580 [Bacteroidota bacterium]